MAALEVLALDEATPQIRAPGAADTYTMPRALAVTGGITATTGVMKGPDGSNTAPTFAFSNVTNRGFYRNAGSLVYADVNADIWWTAASSIVMRSNGFYNFSSGTTANSSSDAGFARVAAGVVKVTNGSSGAGVIQTPALTVAALPAAATAGKGARSFVSDASTTLLLGLGTTVTGGGANNVPVYSDGTNWIYG